MMMSPLSVGSRSPGDPLPRKSLPSSPQIISPLKSGVDVWLLDAVQILVRLESGDVLDEATVEAVAPLVP